MKITIYGRQTCPYCVKAKSVVEKLKADGLIQDFEYIDYVSLGLGPDDLSKIAKSEIQTVPVVLLDEVYIGGFSDMVKRFS